MSLPVRRDRMLVVQMFAAVGQTVDIVVTVGGALLAAVVCYNVFSRYVLAADLAWSNEIAIFLLVWTTFLGGAAASRRGAHLQVAEILDLMPPPARRVTVQVTRLLVAVVMCFVIYYGADIAWRNMEQQTTVLYWPVGLLYAACPVGTALMLLFTIEQAIFAERTAE